MKLKTPTKRKKHAPSAVSKKLLLAFGYPNVWMGTTCGVRSSYPRIDDLRRVPAVVRFISAEPLLESLHDINLAGIHWLIAGGESGSGFRAMNDEWALQLRDRCREHGVAFHFKQHPAFRSGTDPLLRGVKYHESPLVQIKIAAAHRRSDEDTDPPISPGKQAGEHISELSADFRAEEQL